jgi:two-component system cell cycle sensor histidine kinase/response regulator CckA
MRAGIRTRILGGVLLIIGLTAGLALYFGLESERSLTEAVGRTSVFLAEEISKRISHNIYGTVAELRHAATDPLFQETLQASNRQFEELGHGEDWIEQKEREWISVPGDKTTPFMGQLIDNRLSEALRKLMGFHERQGSRGIKEVLVTNRYGAIIAETEKSPHYRQDNQEWWQLTRTRGLYVTDAGHGEIGTSYRISAGIGINNEIGEFIGAIKAVLAIKGVVREAEIAARRYETTRIKLITRDGRLIYRTKAFKFMESVSDEPYFKEIKGQSGFFLIRNKGGKWLYSYARSGDYRGLESLAWIIVVGHNADEVLAPARELRNRMVGVGITLVALTVLIALFISRSITGPVSGLIEGAEEFGRGNLQYRIRARGRDELGRLADAFNRMAAERMGAEETLRGSEERFRAIFEQAAIGVCQVETESGRFLEVNQKYCDIVGRTREEITGTSFMEFTHPDDLQESLDKNQRLGRGEIRDYTLEKRYVRKDGAIVWVSITASPMWGVKERPNHHIAMVQDITGRKQAVETLREYQKAVESSNEMIAVVDREYRYRVVNRAFLEQRGAERDQIIGHTVEEILGKEVFENTVRPYLDRCFQGENVAYETRLEYPEIGPRDLEIEYFPIKGDGEITRVVGIIRDVTEEKRLEAQFIQAQKMESIGRLAGGVAHDFNNLLTTIIGFSDMTLMRLPEGDPVCEYVQEIKHAGERAASLTAQLLAFSRKQVIQPRVMVLNTVIQETEKMLSRLIGEHIDVVTVLEPGLWNVRANPAQMSQVLMNLAVNARDAMPGGGKLTIETANVALDWVYARQHGVDLQPGPYVMLAVSDTGIGMDEETRSQIFEPFFTTKEKGKGTGLGLSTVYGIVKQNKGYVWVYSEPGKGTAFKIYLPRIEGEAKKRKADDASPDMLKGNETILLVENEESVRRLSEEVLGECGYRVLAASDGEDAMTLSEQYGGEIHLLLTDMVMPGMSGRDLAEGMISLRPGIKVLYMSGYTDDAIVRHGGLDEGDEFLQKPFTPEVLARKVREVLD